MTCVRQEGSETDAPSMQDLSRMPIKFDVEVNFKFSDAYEISFRAQLDTVLFRAHCAGGGPLGLRVEMRKTLSRRGRMRWRRRWDTFSPGGGHRQVVAGEAFQ